MIIICHAWSKVLSSVSYPLSFSAQRVQPWRDGQAYFIALHESDMQKTQDPCGLGVHFGKVTNSFSKGYRKSETPTEILFSVSLFRTFAYLAQPPRRWWLSLYLPPGSSGSYHKQISCPVTHLGVGEAAHLA